MNCNLKKKENCNHQITKFPFCNKCCCIYNPIKNISSMNKRLNSIKDEITFGTLYKKMINSTDKNINKFVKLKKESLPNIKNRKDIIEKIFRVITIYKYSLSTFYLSIVLLDEIFIQNKYSKKYFISNEEIALGSLFLAIKCNEQENNFLISLSQINYFYSSSIKIPKGRLKLLEILCLKQLNYNIYKNTPYDYLNLYIKIGIIFNNEIQENSNLNVVYLNSKISKLSYEILDNLMRNSNEYFIIKPYLISLGIILYSKEKIMHCNNIEMFIYAYNISEKELLKTKNFIKENCEKKNKINYIINYNSKNSQNNNIIMKKVKNSSQSPFQKESYKLQKLLLLRPKSLTSVNSRTSSKKKSFNLGSSVSTSSDEFNNGVINHKIIFSGKNFCVKENTLNYSFSFTYINSMNSYRKKNILNIRPLSQITEMKNSCLLRNNRRLVNLNEINHNFSQKIKKCRTIKELLKEKKDKKSNYTSNELSYLISHSSYKNKTYNKNNNNNNYNTKKKKLNIKPCKLNNKNIDLKQKEIINNKEKKINNIIKNSIDFYNKMTNHKRTHSLSTFNNIKDKNVLTSLMKNKNILNYCKIVNRKTKVLY